MTVEDHYGEGGLGDAVAGELSADGVKVHKLAVRELPHSGKAEELLAKYGIDAAAISNKVKALVRPFAKELHCCSVTRLHEAASARSPMQPCDDVTM